MMRNVSGTAHDGVNNFNVFTVVLRIRLLKGAESKVLQPPRLPG